MANGLLRQVLGQQRQPNCACATPEASDGELLQQFVTCEDEAAFEALVRRHGPMVLAVCRRVLQDGHDAEDAFQATFLVLVRKAGSIGKPELLGNWLYGVAYRIAAKAKAHLFESVVEALAVLPAQSGVAGQENRRMQRWLFEPLERNSDIAGIVQPDLLAQMDDGVARRMRGAELADFACVDRHYT